MIKKSNVIQEIIGYMQDNIKNNNWIVGEKIPSENKLTEILGVSRASVHVAIQQFVALGILKSVHGKGTFLESNDLRVFGEGLNVIDEYDCSNLNKVLEFRNIVEPESCYLAALNATSENMDNLKLYVDNMKINVGNPDKFVKYDILFHEEICNASHNPLIKKCMREVFEQTIENHKQLNEIFGYQDGIFYHVEIIKSLKVKNAKKAKKLMHEHLQKAIDVLKSKFD